MASRSFAPWVEPVAARLREGRAEIVELARSVPPEAWSRPSPNPGWRCKDLLAHLGTLFPRDERWRHRHGAPGHGADHVIPAFVSPSLTIPVVAGHLTLGTWQAIVVVDTNRGNRTRRVRFSFLPG